MHNRPYIDNEIWDLVVRVIRINPHLKLDQGVGLKLELNDWFHLENSVSLVDNLC